MINEVTLRIILENPVSGVEYGIQKGSGNKYETVQQQMGASVDLVFELDVKVKFEKYEEPIFFGPFAQGTLHERFIYIDIGTYAGQQNTPWSRRLKIPLKSITKALINKTSVQPVLFTKVPGTAKDGSPNCATVKPFSGWHYV